MPPKPDDSQSGEDPGLPRLHTWRAVYLFVIGSFIVWVVLLFVLTSIFS
jgi:hypothetical protein